VALPLDQSAELKKEKNWPQRKIKGSIFDLGAAPGEYCAGLGRQRRSRRLRLLAGCGAEPHSNLLAGGPDSGQKKSSIILKKFKK
jgi:hypothetical protein